MVSCLVLAEGDRICGVDLSRVPAAGEWLDIDGDFYRISSVVWQVSFFGSSEYAAVLKCGVCPLSKGAIDLRLGDVLVMAIGQYFEHKSKRPHTVVLQHTT